MRLFVAAELPDELLDALSETSAILRDTVRGRYVGPDLFHVTLAFLGEVPQARVGEVADCVAAACEGHPSFQTCLGGLGTFGRRSSAVVWQGFCAGDDAWSSLAADVRSSLLDAGFSFDAKGFIPHVTLMRRANVDSGHVPMPQVARGVISSVALFSSDLTGPRPRYEVVDRFALE